MAAEKMRRRLADVGGADVLDLKLLERLGTRLDARPKRLEGKTIRQFLVEKLLRVRTRQGELRPMALNRAQQEYESRCGKQNIVLKARQLGITTYVAARFFVHTITRRGTLSVQVAHDQGSAEEIFRMVHRFLENLPERLRAGALCTSRANVRQVVFPRLDSEYRVETAADPNAGRGLTIQNLHCSEVARWPGDAAETLAGLRAAVPAGGEIVLESTPNGAAGAFYAEWQRAEETGYVRHFFPWWWEPSYRRPTGDGFGELSGEEAPLAEQFGLDGEQIAFRREKRANFGARFVEEYPEDAESCFRSSGECVFDLETIERRMRELAPPVESGQNGCLQLWWPAQAGRKYVIGVDPAEGNAGGDYSCAQVLDTDAGMQCAELRGHFDPPTLARRVTELATRYNGALVAVERNNHGHAVIAQMLTVHGYANLFPAADGEKAGWLTTRVNRPQMLELLAALLAHSPRLFHSRRLLEECRTFVRQENGRAEAAQGTHDDAVMAMAVAASVRMQGGHSQGTQARRLPGAVPENGACNN
jgi:hypothetical protein